MKHYGVGIIGYGGFGKFLHNSWSALMNVKIVAIADRKQAKDPGIGIRFYTDWHKLLEDDEVDIVSIVTPPSTHMEISCAAMEAGKDVLVEKPLATTVDAAKNIIATRDRTGRVAAVNYMMRFNPIVEALSELSRRKVFGELRRADVENYAQDSGLPEEHWFWDRHISGGILIEHAVHFIDLVGSLTDQKHILVSGFSHSRNERQQDQVLASVLYERGLIATHYHSFAFPGFFENTSLRLVYDLAVIDIDGWIPLLGTIRALVNSSVRGELSMLPGFSVTVTQKVADADDESRPEGWGDVSTIKTACEKIFSHGIPYQVDELVRGTFNTGKSKAIVYKECVSKVLEDLIRKIENPEHRLRVSLENSLTSLEIACLAASSSLPENVS